MNVDPLTTPVLGAVGVIFGSIVTVAGQAAVKFLEVIVSPHFARRAEEKKWLREQRVKKLRRISQDGNHSPSASGQESGRAV